MSALPFSKVGRDEQARAFATLVSAFTDDPVERWLYPEPQQYLTRFPEFLGAMGGQAFEEGTVWRLGEFAAVAVWLAPGVEPDGVAISTVLAGSVSADKHADMFLALEQMDAAHPKHPHWYLPWFGVDAALQGQGIGSRLMDACLGMVDASRLPAYLETPNPRNISFYRRHGFEVTGETRAGACPRIVFMARAAR